MPLSIVVRDSVMLGSSRVLCPWMRDFVLSIRFQNLSKLQ
jgi:hypothetical protein